MKTVLGALIFGAALAMALPGAASAQPASVGNAASAAGNPLRQPEAVTQPSQRSAAIPPNTGNAAEARGTGARTATRSTTRQVARNRAARVGNGASATGGYGTGPRRTAPRG